MELKLFTLRQRHHGYPALNKTILYLVFGKKQEYQLELTYSVLSAAHFLRSENIRIVLVCDQENRRPDLPVEHIIVPEATINDWVKQYKYAAKAKALALAVERYGGVVALVDTDTAFLRNPMDMLNRVRPGQSVMHAEEGYLGFHSYWGPLLDRLDGCVEGYRVTEDSRMMNSGVVALHEVNRAAIPRALKLMTTLNAIEPIFNIEQFSFTAALEACGQLVVCDDVIWHYWGHNRRFAHTQLRAIFPAYDSDSFYRHLDNPPPIGMPRIPTLVRARGRLLQLFRRCDSDYRFAYIASLCALFNCDNDWANVSLDVLNAIEHLPAAVAIDFNGFRVERLESYPWLNHAVRQRWRMFWKEYEKIGLKE